jgi:hypothetical protein
MKQLVVNSAEIQLEIIRFMQYLRFWKRILWTVLSDIIQCSVIRLKLTDISEEPVASNFGVDLELFFGFL